MYSTFNYRTKKALKEAVAAGEQVTYYQPGPFGGNEPTEGIIYREAHKWYARPPQP